MDITPPPTVQRDAAKVSYGVDPNTGLYHPVAVDANGRQEVVGGGGGGGGVVECQGEDKNTGIKYTVSVDPNGVQDVAVTGPVTVAQPVTVNGSVTSTPLASGIDYVDRIGTKLYLNEGTTNNRFGFGTITTTPNPVWGEGGAYPWPTAVENITVSSDNAGDVGQMVYFGNLLDASFNPLPPVVVALNGQNPVAVGAAYRCATGWLMSGTIAGTVRAGYGAVVGGVPANTLVHISPQDNRSLQGIYTVPANRQCLIHRVDFAVDSNLDTNVVVQARMPVAGAPWWNLSKYVNRRNVAQVDFDSKIPVRLEAGYDLQLVASVASGSTDCSAYFTCLEVVVPLVTPAP